jgi:hypothetical protein
LDGLLTRLAPIDWIFLGSVALIVALMAGGIYGIRAEIRSQARIRARSVRLKTSREQRLQWRRSTQSKDLLALLDDIDTLVRLTDADDEAIKRDRKEGMRLSWMSRRIPLRTAFLGSLLLAGVLSAIFMVIAQGPSNPIP